ncbi:nuclear hormone receptor [Holotrichia oblita]|uniref:Nuclear hormone receptor n=1 Tax=Holotrichia oblita TaxID=644536 RepID=A0ACB9T251_HOLOL|nr:nuclear hormone receptor [Holotrichia oblita]
MCDGCGGQNKNTTLIGMCSHWLSMQSIVSKIEVIFPVRGHPFIPPARVFGHIEIKCRKREIIPKPEDYLDMFSQCGTVLKVGEDVPIYDWKAEIAKVIKIPGTWHIALSQAKRMIITKTKNATTVVRREIAYNSDGGSAKSVSKKRKNLRDLKPAVIHKQNLISQKKKKDVNELILAHYGDAWKNEPDLKFYKYVLEEATEQTEKNPAEVERLCENFEEGPNVVV